MNVTGTLHEVRDTQSISDNFSKREFILKIEDGQYSQYCSFELHRNHEVLDSFKPGDVLHVEFNLRGREWTNPQGDKKYFNTLQAWKIERKGAPQVEPETEDDLPF